MSIAENKLSYYPVLCECRRAKAEYEVYNHHQLHCERCMKEAVDCDVPVLVRRINR